MTEIPFFAKEEAHTAPETDPDVQISTLSGFLILLKLKGEIEEGRDRDTSTSNDGNLRNEVIHAVDALLTDTLRLC